jgi:hypothetical protein
MPRKLTKARAGHARSKRKRAKTEPAPAIAPERPVAHSYEPPPPATAQPRQPAAAGYQPAMAEWRRIAIIAGALFLILIVLAFILR